MLEIYFQLYSILFIQFNINVYIAFVLLSRRALRLHKLGYSSSTGFILSYVHMYFLQSGGNPGPGGIPGGPQGDLPLHGRAHAPQPCGRRQQVGGYSPNQGRNYR
jgi:hypothetical protein